MALSQHPIKTSVIAVSVPESSSRISDTALTNLSFMLQSEPIQLPVKTAQEALYSNAALNQRILKHISERCKEIEREREQKDDNVFNILCF